MLRQTILTTDLRIALKFGLLGESGSLTVFLFHKLFRNDGERKSALGDPMEGTGITFLEALVVFLMKRRYHFATPETILAGLNPDYRHVLFTFDDGYACNARALPVMERHGVPMLFHIATGHVASGRAFWWDVLHRERHARGADPVAIWNEKRVYLNHHTVADIEARLTDEFGSKAFIPQDETDRPFSIAELKSFAAHPLVHLGNHTRAHAPLANYGMAEAEAEITACQDDLRAWLGEAPVVISYPNGAFGPEHEAMAARLGLRIGIGITSARNRIPFDNIMNLNRFWLPDSGAYMIPAARVFMGHGPLQRLWLRLSSRGVPS